MGSTVFWPKCFEAPYWYQLYDYDKKEIQKGSTDVWHGRTLQIYLFLNFKFSSLELRIFFSALALALSVINHGTTVRNCLILWQKGKTKGINRSMAVFQKDVQGLCGQMVNLVRNIAEVTEWINGEIQSCFGIIHVAFGRGQNVGTIQNIDTRRMLLM